MERWWNSVSCSLQCSPNWKKCPTAPRHAPRGASANFQQSVKINSLNFSTCALCGAARHVPRMCKFYRVFLLLRLGKDTFVRFLLRLQSSKSSILAPNLFLHSKWHPTQYNTRNKYKVLAIRLKYNQIVVSSVQNVAKTRAPSLPSQHNFES